MNATELKARQDAIWERVRDGDAPIEFDDYFHDQGVVNLFFPTKNRAAIVGYGVKSHEYAQAIIDKIQAFYALVTPVEIELLNTEAYLCLNCNVAYTADEFPVARFPPEGLIKQLYPEFDSYSRGIPAYCNNCVHKVPLIQTRGNNRPGFVYLAETDAGFKLGCSRTPEKRVATLNREYEYAKLLYTIPVIDMFVAETHLNLIFCHQHITRELYDLSLEDVARIQEMAE